MTPKRRRVQPAVLKVLRRDPRARCDDNVLIWSVCREMGYDLLPEQISLIAELPKFSSIIRSRAKIQQQGRFRPPLEVWRERGHWRKGGATSFPQQEGGPNAGTLG